MLSRCAQVGVDQKRTFAELGKNHGKIGGHIAAPFAGPRTDDRQHPVPDPGLGPADQQLRPQRPQLLGAGVKRLVSDHEFPADALVAEGQVRKTILLCDRTTQVFFCNQSQRDRGFAKSESIDALRREYPLYVAGAELPILHEEAAEPAILLCDDVAQSFDRQDVLLGIHRASLIPDSAMLVLRHRAGRAMQLRRAATY